MAIPRLSSAQSRWALAAVVVLVIIILAVLGAGRAMARRYGDYLSGMWVADPAFLQQAALSDMQLYISPPGASARSNGRRKGYLIMVNTGGEFLANQAIEIDADFAWGSALGTLFKARHDACEGKVTMKLADQEDEGGKPPFPRRLRMTVSALDGSLALRDNKKLWALLSKDFEASASAAEAWKSPAA